MTATATATATVNSTDNLPEAPPELEEIFDQLADFLQEKYETGDVETIRQTAGSLITTGIAVINSAFDDFEAGILIMQNLSEASHCEWDFDAD